MPRASSPTAHGVADRARERIERIERNRRYVALSEALVEFEARVRTYPANYPSYLNDMVTSAPKAVDAWAAYAEVQDASQAAEPRMRDATRRLKLALGCVLDESCLPYLRFVPGATLKKLQRALDSLAIAEGRDALKAFLEDWDALVESRRPMVKKLLEMLMKGIRDDDALEQAALLYLQIIRIDLPLRSSLHAEVSNWLRHVVATRIAGWGADDLLKLQTELHKVEWEVAAIGNAFTSPIANALEDARSRDQ